MPAPSTARARPLLSILFSFRNEEEVLPELIQRLQSVAAKLPVDCEFIFVNDASTDRSLEILVEHASREPRLKIVTLSRRFGVMEGFLAAMNYARGDAVVTMDCDLQDPPELIPEMVEKWQAGATVVYTVRTGREGESALKIFLTRMAYKAIRWVSNEEMPVEAGDFKLIGRRVVDELLQLKERDPYLRGLVTWIGFKQTPVYYKRAARTKGSDHFPLLRSKGPFVQLAAGLTSFSVVPLTAVLVLGILLTLLSLGAAVALGIMKLFALAIPMWAWVITALALFTGLQLGGIGIVGLYVGRIFNDVRNRPRYIVDNTVGLDAGVVAPGERRIGNRPN